MREKEKKQKFQKNRTHNETKENEWTTDAPKSVKPEADQWAVFFGLTYLHVRNTSEMTLVFSIKTKTIHIYLT